MKIEVLIEYDERLSEVTFCSKTTQFSETRPARIGLSRSIVDETSNEMVEFVGEDWEFLKTAHDIFQKEPTRKNCTLRVVNPFESSTFEPEAAFRIIDFFSRYILAKFCPNTWNWRMSIPLMTKYELSIKIPGYKFFNPQKKVELEKMLRTKFKSVTFIS